MNENQLQATNKFLWEEIERRHANRLKEIDEWGAAQMQAIEMEYQRDVAIWVLGPVLFLAGIIFALFFTS